MDASGTPLKQIFLKACGTEERGPALLLRNMRKAMHYKPKAEEASKKKRKSTGTAEGEEAGKGGKARGKGGKGGKGKKGTTAMDLIP